MVVLERGMGVGDQALFIADDSGAMEVSRQESESAAIEFGQRATPEVVVGDMGRQERPSEAHIMSGEDDDRGALDAPVLFDRIPHPDVEVAAIVVTAIGPLLADRSEARGDVTVAVNGGSRGNDVEGAGLG